MVYGPWSINIITLTLILFDGICNFCNGVVNFIIRNDHKGVFKFAALQSEVGQLLKKKYGLLDTVPNSIILIENGIAYQKSTAALRICRYLPWYLQWLRVWMILPRFLRDGVYDLVAANRYRWFGKREQCMIPTAEVRSRFLTDPGQISA